MVKFFLASKQEQNFYYANLSGRARYVSNPFSRCISFPFILESKKHFFQFTTGPISRKKRSNSPLRHRRGKILVLRHSVHVPETFPTHLAEVHHFLLAAESKNEFFESTDANLPLVSAPFSTIFIQNIEFKITKK